MKRLLSRFELSLGQLSTIVFLLMIISAMGFYFFEPRTEHNSNIFSSIWWAIVTMTTVGYGDIYPVTWGGRLMGFLSMISGIGMVSIITGNLASSLVDRKARKRKGLLEVKLSNHVVFIGWNNFGFDLANTLKTSGVLDGKSLVLVNDLPQEKRDEIAFSLDFGEQLQFVWGNVTQKSVIHKATPQLAKIIYILSQEGKTPQEADQQSIYAALAARPLAPKIPIFGEVVMQENREHMWRTGITDILVRGEMTNRILGLMGSNPIYSDFLRALIGVNQDSLLCLRPILENERKLTWDELVNQERQNTHNLPLALCRANKSLSLQDVLDEGSSLDSFILELFETAGQETSMGSQKSHVLTNPAGHTEVSEFDSLIYIKGSE